MDTLAIAHSSYFVSRIAALDAGIPDDNVIHTADEFFAAEDDTVKCLGCETVFADRDELDDNMNCSVCAEEPDWQADESRAWDHQRGCNTARGR